MKENFLAKRKKEITKASLPVFAKKGFTHTTMKDIMIAANVSRGGLYGHFNNIEDVFMEVLKQVDENDLDILLPTKSETSLGEQLSQWLQSAIQRVLNSETNLIRANAEFFLTYDDTQFPYLKLRHEKLLKQIKNLLLSGIKTGEFSSTLDINSLSNVLIAQIDGIMLHHHNHKTTDAELKAMIAIQLEMLQYTLRPKEEP